MGPRVGVTCVTGTAVQPPVRAGTGRLVWTNPVNWCAVNVPEFVTTMALRIKRFPDNCYAVVSGNRRGPVGPDRGYARRRFLARVRRGLSGFIAYAGSDKRVSKAAVR